MNLGQSWVYADGTFKRYDEARVGLLSHGLNYGTGCFEGIRGFWNADEDELYLLQLEDHYRRLASSSRLLLMQLPHDTATLCDLTVELCARNEFRRDVYVRPLAYKNNEDVGVRLHNVRDAFAIVALPFDKYFDETVGLKACVSSWRRIDDTVAPARAKITGVYINSALAKTDAQLNGFDEAILLSHDGHVAEGSAENVFLVKDGKLYTPDPTQNILEGITRKSVVMLAREELGIECVERSIDRSELYAADELFFTGSAVGLTWVASVDHRQIGDGKEGPVTRELAKLFSAAIRGRLSKYASWVRPTYGRSAIRRSA